MAPPPSTTIDIYSSPPHAHTLFPNHLHPPHPTQSHDVSFSCIFPTALVSSMPAPTKKAPTPQRIAPHISSPDDDSYSLRSGNWTSHETSVSETLDQSSSLSSRPRQRKTTRRERMYIATGRSIHTKRILSM